METENEKLWKEMKRHWAHYSKRSKDFMRGELAKERNCKLEDIS